MLSSKDVAENILHKVNTNLGLDPVVFAVRRQELRAMIIAELEEHVEGLVVQSLRKRLPAVLEKVKDVWIDELKDKELFSEPPNKKA